jgi:hypothetical protein
MKILLCLCVVSIFFSCSKGNNAKNSENKKTSEQENDASKTTTPEKEVTDIVEIISKVVDKHTEIEQPDTVDLTSTADERLIGIEKLMPKELDKNDYRYKQFSNMIFDINEMYISLRRDVSNDLLNSEKINFLRNALFKFLRYDESGYFDIQKIFPFIKVIPSDDSIITVYTWEKDNYVEAHQTIIKYIMPDNNPPLLKCLDDFYQGYLSDDTKYNKVTRLKDNIYLLSGSNYQRHGFTSYTFTAIEIKEYVIQPYYAFNKEYCLGITISGSTDDSYAMYYLGLERVIDCVVQADDTSVKIEFTKIIPTDETKIQYANKELFGEQGYFGLTDFYSEKVILEFDGTNFTGDYEKIK